MSSIVEVTSVVDVSSIFRSQNKVTETVRTGGIACAIRARGTRPTKKQYDAMIEYVKLYGAHGMIYFAINSDYIDSRYLKFIAIDEIKALLSVMQVVSGDIVYVVSELDHTAAHNALGALGQKILENKDNL